MSEGEVQLVGLDPYDPVTGMLIPFVTQRILQFAREYSEEMDPEQTARVIMSRLWTRDPTIAILAFVQGRSKLVGHAVATVESDGVNSWVFVSQVKVDGNVGDAVLRAIEVADQWAQAYSSRYLEPNGQRPITRMTMATHRSDRAWIKRCGFETERSVMGREVGSKPKE